MLPPYIHEDIKSDAERKIFDIIKSQLNDNWYCLHSLGVAHHERKVQGEIDFVLIGEKGVFCIEVKGGFIERENGVWKFINRFGKVSIKTESPFMQASTAMFSLMSAIRNKFGDMNKILFGYGVAFPDVEFNIKSPEWSDEIIYDIRDKKDNFSKYINKLYLYWKKKSPQKRSLNNFDIKKLIGFLRGDFELIQPLSCKLDELEKKLIKLTENQYRALDRLKENDRIIFKGTAGTGKTLLAIEKAKREALSNNKVLFLCYNKLLAAKIKSHFNMLKLEVDANTINGHFFDAIIHSTYKNEFISLIKSNSNDEELFDALFPDFFMKAFSENPKKYDYLIIDEGQDLLNFEWMSPLDHVIQGGFEKGRWSVFYDPNNQRKVFNRFDQTFVEYLKSCGAVEYILDLNCRNTQPICTQTSLISGFRLEQSLIEEGEKVDYRYFSTNEDLKGQVSEVICHLLDEHIDPNDIVILYPRIEDSTILNRLHVPCLIEKLTENDIDNFNNNTIYHSTVSAFKGLESKIILFVGVRSLDDDWNNTINYVGMTRAKEILYVFLEESYKEKIFRKFQEYMIRRITDEGFRRI